MSPVVMMMILNPATIAIGDSEEMKKAVRGLDRDGEAVACHCECVVELSK